MWPMAVENHACLFILLQVHPSDELSHGRDPAAPLPPQLSAAAAAATPALSDEEFYAIPEHLRGLDRVVDPLAPDFMASG